MDGVAPQPGRPRDGVEALGVGLVAVEVRHQDGVLEGGQRGLYLGDGRTAVKGLAAVLIAVTGKQDFWLDLLEAVDDAATAEVGRAARPCRAQAGRGEEGDAEAAFQRAQAVTLNRSRLRLVKR